MSGARSLGSLADTLGSSATANVNIDAGTLFVDAVNNNVGIGTNSPSSKLSVGGNPPASGAIAGVASSGGTSLALSDNVNSSLYVRHNSSGIATISTDAGGGLAFATNGSTERMRLVSNGNIGIGNTSPAHALSIAGALRTTSVSTNYAQSNATAITINTTTPTTVASVSITTLGKPVLLLVAGDRNPATGSEWHYGQFYRDSTSIGKRYIGQISGGSFNQPFSHCFVDAPGAGTYTYSYKCWQGSGSITYGEEGDIQAPTIIAMELI